MINLSAGLGYIHHALKRQSGNRQFHIAQGLALIFKYYDARHEINNENMSSESSYNVGRAYHALGLYHLALQYYQEAQNGLASSDVIVNALYNVHIMCITSYRFSNKY